MKYHITKDGRKILLKDLELNHLKNIIKFIEKKAEEGILIEYGSFGFEADDMWYDQDVIKGKKVLKLLHYKDYIAELHKRTL